MLCITRHWLHDITVNQAVVHIVTQFWAIRFTHSDKLNKTIRDYTSPALCTLIPLPGQSHLQRTQQRRNYPFCCTMLSATEQPLLQWTCYSALSTGRKTTKIAPSPLDFITLPDEDWATAIGNMQRKFGKEDARDMIITILCQRSHRQRNDSTRTTHLDVLAFEVRHRVSESSTHVHWTQRLHVLGYNLIAQADPIIVLQTNTTTAFINSSMIKLTHLRI